MFMFCYSGQHAMFTVSNFKYLDIIMMSIIKTHIRSVYRSESRFRSLGATEPKVELRMRCNRL